MLDTHTHASVIQSFLHCVKVNLLNLYFMLGLVKLGYLPQKQYVPKVSQVDTLIFHASLACYISGPQDFFVCLLPGMCKINTHTRSDTRAVQAFLFCCWSFPRRLAPVQSAANHKNVFSLAAPFIICRVYHYYRRDCSQLPLVCRLHQFFECRCIHKHTHTHT